MLTNQIIGAGQNASSHMPRQNAPIEPVQPLAQPSSSTGNAQRSVEQMTTRAVDPNQEVQKAGSDANDRPALELPKRVEMFIAVVDSMPDAVPESIYDAKVQSDSSEKPSSPAEQS